MAHAPFQMLVRAAPLHAHVKMVSAEKLVGKRVRQRLQNLASRIVMATVSAQTVFVFVAADTLARTVT